MNKINNEGKNEIRQAVRILRDSDLSLEATGSLLEMIYTFGMIQEAERNLAKMEERLK